MRRIFYIFGIVLVVCAAIFLVLSYVSPVNKALPQYSQIVIPQSVFYFKPESVTTSCLGEKQTATLFLNSGTNRLSSAQIELSYNPQVIENFTLTPAQNNFFGDKSSYQINLSEIRPDFGRASLAISLTPTQEEKMGNKPVATISFTVPNELRISPVTISFVNKSQVNSRDDERSLLKETPQFVITCTFGVNSTSTQSSRLKTTP